MKFWQMELSCMNDAADGPINKAMAVVDHTTKQRNATMVSEYAPKEVPTFLSDPVDQRKLTYGEKAVGLTFNPSGDPMVNEIKTLFAQVIDLCNEQRNAAVKAAQREKAQLFSVAIIETQTAQMWAVKGITFPA